MRIFIVPSISIVWSIVKVFVGQEVLGAIRGRVETVGYG
jgi:hypothetical protein